MLERLRRSVTYANVAASGALFVALSGVAWAAATIGPDDIRPNAVRSGHVKQNALRGGDVRESSLGVVPSANRIGRARVITFREDEFVSETDPVTAFRLGGLRVRYFCSKATSISARTRVDNATIHVGRLSGGTNPATALRSANLDFDRGELVSVGGAVGTIVYTHPGGSVVSVDYVNNGAPPCLFAGTAVGG